MVGTGKKRSLSESRGVQIGGGHLQQKTLGRSWDRSVRQVDHIGGVFTNRGFTVGVSTDTYIRVSRKYSNHLLIRRSRKSEGLHLNSSNPRGGNRNIVFDA